MASPITLDNSNLVSFSEDEIRQIDEYAKKINILNPKFILNYAVKLQRQIAMLPDLLLTELKDDSFSDVSKLIVSLLSELTKFTSDDTVFTTSVKNRERFSELRNEYAIILDKISSLLSLLEEQQLIVMQNLSVLKGLHKKGFLYHKKLSMFIEAGKRKLQSIKEYEAQASKSSKPTIDLAFKKDSLAHAISRFENRLSELEKTRALATMFNAQVVLYIQNNSSSLEKIKETANVTIPTWEKRIQAILRISDLLELVSETNKSIEFFDNNKSLSENIADLHKTLIENSKNKMCFDELYLIAKQIQKTLKS